MLEPLFASAVYNIFFAALVFGAGWLLVQHMQMTHKLRDVEDRVKEVEDRVTNIKEDAAAYPNRTIRSPADEGDPMDGTDVSGAHMEYQLLRLELLERLGRHLERARSGGLAPDEVDDLRRILLRRDALVRRFDVGRLESFGRKVFRNQCEARRLQGLPLPHSGPHELFTGRPPA